MRRGALVALAVVAAVDVAMLAGVWRGRQATPEAQLVLDERELSLVAAERDSTLVALSLVTHHEVPPDRDAQAFQPVWIDQQKLQELGFDCSVQPLDPQAPGFYRGSLPRRAYLVMELGGAAWQRLAERWRQSAPAREAERERRGFPLPSGTPEERAGRELASVSRLVKVDVGRDPAALRARYPDRARHLILPVAVTLHFADGQFHTGPPHLFGRAVEVLPAQVVVPSAWRAAFDGLGRVRPRGHGRSDEGTATPWEPRYEVTLAVDPSYRPYVMSARRLITGDSP